MQSVYDERLWLAWLAKVRIVILTFLLAIELLIARLTATTLPMGLFIGTVLVWYGVSVCHFFLLSIRRHYRLQAFLQVFTDLALVTMMVYATGGLDSSLNFLYPLVILVASVLLPRIWT